MKFKEKLTYSIKKHCLSKPDEECCGLVVFSKITNEDIVCPCQNTNPEKKYNFTINPNDYLNATAIGDIKAVYHSHPAGKVAFSEFDKMNSNNHNLTYILYHIKSDDFLYYYPNKEMNKYIGREFSYGKSDCFSLIKDYYKREKNIDIIEYDQLVNRDSSWRKKSAEHFQKMLEANPNFKEVDSQKLEKDDVLAYQYFDRPFEHFGVYLGDNLVLHQKIRRLSCIEPVDKDTGLIFKTYRYDSH